MHPDKPSHVNAVTSTLEGDAVEWLASLYNEEDPELMNMNTFMQEM